ncbi:MAG TPA: ATP-binding protein [Candidatus Pacearchaeota archaeon]|nr:ATP-binding protein [Candidatus Pacearchaeota archaeon]HPR79616.1 ATP-binding protein [Candidatus Pacearchaeota archaeon]
MKFINRQSELDELNKRWKEDSSEFFIIYGKRRVGKTELIKQFIKNKPSIYFVADKRSDRDQLKELGMLFGNYFNDKLLVKNGFNEWLDLFQYLKEKTKDRFVFAVDEYPYIVETNKSISSLFQKGWEEYLKGSKIFLILSGSSISMMESEVLSYKSPLFGRRTGQAQINPLTFKQAWQFFPEKSFDDFLSIYTICGGMPAYLLEIKKEISLDENIKTNIFKKTSFLYNEVEFILKEELREPKSYLSILRAISWSKTKFGEISNDTGLEKNILTKYIDVLVKLQLMEKEVPVTEENLQKSKQGIYKISDNFLRFWFQYVFPYKSDLEIERYDEVSRKIEETFGAIKANTYEKVCRELLSDFRNKIFSFERIGRWWKKEEEIDIVGVNKKTKEIIFGECKWSNNLVDKSIFYDLKRKSVEVKWNNERRKEYFIIFSKSGFTKEMIALAKKEKVFLVKEGDPVNF